MKAKSISLSKIKAIRKTRKQGLTVGELSWKFDLTISEIMRIIKLK